MAERLLTLDRLATRWGVPWDVVLDLARQGKLKSVQVGWDRFYPESALAEYLESKGLASDEYSHED
jgi:hypothetical protein